MTPQQQLRAERRARFYGGVQHERNAAPTPTEAVDMARRAAEVDAGIYQQRPELRAAMSAARSAGGQATSRAAAALELRRRQLALLGLG